MDRCACPLAEISLEVEDGVMISATGHGYFLKRSLKQQNCPAKVDGISSM